MGDNNKTLVTHYFHAHLKKLEQHFVDKKWSDFISQTQVLFDTFNELVNKTLLTLLR